MGATVGQYRGCRYARQRVRVVFPLAQTNPLLWVAWTPDGSDVICWVDTKREMEAAVDEWLALMVARAPEPAVVEDASGRAREIAARLATPDEWPTPSAMYSDLYGETWADFAEPD